MKKIITIIIMIIVLVSFLLRSANEEIKAFSAESPELSNVLSSSGVGQDIAMRASPVIRNVSLSIISVSAFAGHNFSSCCTCVRTCFRVCV